MYLVKNSEKHRLRQSGLTSPCTLAGVFVSMCENSLYKHWCCWFIVQVDKREITLGAAADRGTRQEKTVFGYSLAVAHTWTSIQMCVNTW